MSADLAQNTASFNNIDDSASLPQQQQQQQRTATPQQQENTTATQQKEPVYTRLIDLETELQEMDSLITAETPLQKMPATFRARYLQKMDDIAGKKKEVATHMKYMVDNKFMTQEAAMPYLEGIDDNNLDKKRPVFGYVEASVQSHMKSAMESNRKMNELMENNKRVLAEKDKLAQELELVKKKIRLNDYSAPIVPQHHHSDDFGNVIKSAPLLHKETVSLIRLDEKPNSEDVSRRVINDANMRAMYNYEVFNQTSVQPETRERYAKLAELMSQW